MKKHIVWIIITSICFLAGLAQEPRVIPLVLESDSKAWAFDYVEVTYSLTPDSEPVFEEMAEKVWRIQDRAILILGSTGEILPARLVRRAEIFVQVFVNGESLWVEPKRVHPQKNAVLVTDNSKDVMESLKMSFERVPDIGTTYLAELANYLAGNLSTINMTATSYSVEGYGQVIDGSGTWTGNPIISDPWYLSTTGSGLNSCYTNRWVGIGKDIPDAPLHLFSNSTTAKAKFLVQSDVNSDIEIQSLGSTSHLKMISFLYSNIEFFREESQPSRASLYYNATSDDLLLSTTFGTLGLYGGSVNLHGDTAIKLTSGIVGIGDFSGGGGGTQPTTNLHILENHGNAIAQVQSGFDAAYLFLNGHGNTNNEVQFQIDGAYKGAFGYNATNDNLYLYHHGNVVVKNGCMGIGTTTPIGRLDVNGSIYQRGVILHADYVFQDDYVLESIAEHSAFMWKEKHLPAVPAAQVDDEGREIVEVGQHQRGILEELEKAHIYIQQLQQQLQELRELVEGNKRIKGHPYK